jgi:hypothetical protein
MFAAATARVPVVRAQAADSTAKVAADTSAKLTFGGFVDTYYAWDFNQPANFDRAYTTQPVRHAEFNINLAFLEAKVTGPRYRGRLAVQWGTSVQANYAGEPRLGSVSGPNVSQFIQEATVGYQLGQSLWIDGGIFLAHLGYESWISRDNLSYTRSLIADFSPYYEAGVKATWNTTPKLTTTLTIVNGWQDISVYNTPPAAGIRLDYAASPKFTLSYDNFIGDAAADSAASRLRLYHDFIAQYNGGGRWQLSAVYSLGTESNKTPSGGTATWWGFTTLAKYHATSRLAVVGRVEGYSDPDQVIVVTGLPESFRSTGASLGLDVNLVGPVLWRTEVRGLQSDDAVWPAHVAGRYRKSNAVAVTSLALTF